MIIKPFLNPKAKSPHRCMIIFFLIVSWLYVILGNLKSNYENQQECYQVLKQIDQRQGHVFEKRTATLKSNQKNGGSKENSNKVTNLALDKAKRDNKA
jgi:hypothetical protein